MSFDIAHGVRFKNLGKFKRRPLFPPPVAGAPHAYEGELGTVVFVPDPDRIAVRPDGREHSHGERAGWIFRDNELEVVAGG